MFVYICSLTNVYNPMCAAVLLDLWVTWDFEIQLTWNFFNSLSNVVGIFFFNSLQNFVTHFSTGLNGKNKIVLSED